MSEENEDGDARIELNSPTIEKASSGDRSLPVPNSKILTRLLIE